jgi:glycosyltransferase involved in cell wall biosynthesis
MKADLHVHSKYSKRPSQWILQKLNCPESFTEPMDVYRIAKKKGMALVTITDHNTITGALELAHLPDTFVSEEVTTYFPEDRCKAHVLVYHIDEKQHQDIQDARENICDLVAYLQGEGIVHALAHPLYAINGRLTVAHFEKSLLLFKTLELNGARDELQNQLLVSIVSRLTPAILERLSDEHGIEPRFSDPWVKHVIGGSDDHSSLHIARRHTKVDGAVGVDGFLKNIEAGKAVAQGQGATPQTLAQNLYGIAYQFYKERFKLDRHVNKDIFLRFVDRFLGGSRQNDTGVLAKIYYIWDYRKRHTTDEGSTFQQLVKAEFHKLIHKDPELLSIIKNGNGTHRTGDIERKWYEFVNKVSNGVLVHFGNYLLDHLSGVNLLNMFHAVGSAGALYSVLAPYFVAFSLFTKDRHITCQIEEKFVPRGLPSKDSRRAVRVAHFTDTFYEVNGVALTLQQQVQAAGRMGKHLTVITCDLDHRSHRNGVKNFRPVGVTGLPEYHELKLYYPPFLEMLNFCYENQFTHIHSATPGPIGLAALAIARILKLPINGTYHTSLPQYVRCLTEDGAIEELMWKFILWYYEQMDLVFVPSNSTGDELKAKGISAAKIRQFPRGINTERFHPSKSQSSVAAQYRLEGRPRLLYVGRVSKEKNLSLLARVFKERVRPFFDASLVVVGDGPYLQDMKKALAHTPAVFTGYQEGDALAALYAACDLFVFPSATDTFGNVVLEAQASGVPVIVTDSGGPQENIIPGKTGLVVQANDEEALFGAVKELLLNPDRLKRMGKRARAYMEARSFDRAFDKTWAIYREQGGFQPNGLRARPVATPRKAS